jgi:hypothetical protein
MRQSQFGGAADARLVERDDLFIDNGLVGKVRESLRDTR